MNLRTKLFHLIEFKFRLICILGVIPKNVTFLENFLHHFYFDFIWGLRKLIIFLSYEVSPMTLGIDVF